MYVSLQPIFVVFQHAPQKAGGKQRLRAALIFFPLHVEAMLKSPSSKIYLNSLVTFTFTFSSSFSIIEPAPVANKSSD